jgi:hypothetical protein
MALSIPFSISRIYMFKKICKFIIVTVEYIIRVYDIFKGNMGYGF